MKIEELIGFETLFLDRDGVINVHNPVDYIRKWEDFEFVPGVLETLANFNKHFKHIFIITNQRGVGRGLMTEESLNEIHQKMVSVIESNHGRVDKIYYCTSIDENDPNRKPNIGMALQVKADYPDVDFSKTIMIGDSILDMEFAKNCGIFGVKVGAKTKFDGI
jgi:histidinol-phosphate phosphatase family protein